MSSIAESYNKKGALLYREQLYPEAILTFSKGFELEPENVTILCNRSAAYEASNKSQEALKDAEQALQINPKYIKAYYRKSKALFLCIESNSDSNSETIDKLWNDLMECMKEGLQLDPDNTELLDYKNVILSHPKYLSYISPGSENNENHQVNDKENSFTSNENNNNNNNNNNTNDKNNNESMEKISITTEDSEKALIEDFIEKKSSTENNTKSEELYLEDPLATKLNNTDTLERLSSIYQISTNISTSMSNISASLFTKSTPSSENEDITPILSDVEDSCFPQFESDNEDAYYPAITTSPLTTRSKKKRSTSVVGAPIISSFTNPSVPPISSKPKLSLSNSLPSHSGSVNLSALSNSYTSTHSQSASKFTRAPTHNSTPSATPFTSPNNNLTSTPFHQIPFKQISSTSSIVTSFTPNNPPINSTLVTNEVSPLVRSLSSPVVIQPNDPTPQSNVIKEPHTPTSPSNSNISLYIKSKSNDNSPNQSLVSSYDELDKVDRRILSQSSPSSPHFLHADHDRTNNQNSTQLNAILTSPVAPSQTTHVTTPTTSTSLSASIMEPITMVAKSLFSSFSFDKKKEIKDEDSQVVLDSEITRNDSIDLQASANNLDNNRVSPEDSSSDLPPIEPITVFPIEDANANSHSPTSTLNSPKKKLRATLIGKDSFSENDSDLDNDDEDSSELWPEIDSKNEEGRLEKKESNSFPILNFSNNRVRNSSISSPDIFFYVQNDNAFNSKGVEFYKSRKYAEAINCFNKAIEINPDNYFYYINRSAAKLSYGDPISALDDVEKSISLYPNDPIAYTRKAEIYIFLNSPKHAKRTLVDARDHLTLSDREQVEFEKGIKLAESKEEFFRVSPKLNFLNQLTSKNNDNHETFNSLFNFLPRTPSQPETKSKMQLTNFISPVPVFRKSSDKSNHLTQSTDGTESGKIEVKIEFNNDNTSNGDNSNSSNNINNDNDNNNKKDNNNNNTNNMQTENDQEIAPQAPRIPPLNLNGLSLSLSLDSPRDENQSPRTKSRLRELKRTYSIPSVLVHVDQKTLVLVDKNGKRLSSSDNQYLFDQIEKNRFWDFINNQLHSGKLSLFNSMNNTQFESLIFFLPQQSSIPADPTPLDDYYESHFAFIQSHKIPHNSNNSSDPSNHNHNHHNIHHIHHDDIVADENGEKITFKTLNQIEGIISKNKITILKNPFDRMLGADGQEFNMKGPVSIDIITESYMLAESIHQVQFDPPIPIKLFIIGTSIFPSEVEKIFTNFVLLEEEMIEKMEKKNKAMALMELYWKKYQDDRSANIRANIDKFTNEFRKKPPTTLEEKAHRFNEFTQTFKNEILENELWESAPKEEIDCVIFNLRKQILSQLTDLLRNDNNEEDEKLKNIIQRLNKFVKPEHIGLDPNDGFDDSVYSTAQAEMIAIGEFTAPREKLECLLNCCKIINFQITSMGNIANADELLPRLILLLIHTNPPQLPFNLKFIQLFCEKTDELAEAFYYVTMVESAVYFILNVTAKHLNISEELFNQLMTESDATPNENNATADQKDNNNNSNKKNDHPQIESQTSLTAANQNNDHKPHSDITPSENQIVNINHKKDNSEVLNLHFVAKDANQITTSDIPQLLLEYKRLVTIVQSIDPSLLHEQNS